MPATPTDADRVARLAAELAELGRRLAWARHELLSLPIATAEPEPASPIWTPPAAEIVSSPPVPSPAPPSPTHPDRAGQRGAGEVGGGRVLAWVGGSITLLGVVMFLALAASRGWFGVPARLVLGGLLGLALVGLAGWLHRRPDGQTGALAVAATGIAALYLDVGAATARYHYLPGLVGLLLGLAVAGAGLAIADRWRSEPLAVGAVLGAGVLLPIVAQGVVPLVVALVLVPQLAAAPVVLRRRWHGLALLAALFPVLYGAALVPGAFFTGVDEPRLLAVIAVFVVGAGLAVLGSNRLEPTGTAARLLAAPAPALGVAAVYDDWRGALLAGLLGLAALALLLPGLPGVPDRLSGRLGPPHRLLRLAALTVGAVALFEATTLIVGGASLTGVLLGQALALAVLAGAARRPAPLVVGACYGLFGLVFATLRDAPVAALVHFPAAPYLRLGEPDRGALLTGLALSVLVLLLAVAVIVAGARLRLARPDAETAWLWATVGAIGLYGAAGTVITAVLLAVPRQPGFVGGHAIVTISWTLLALLLLARGSPGRRCGWPDWC